jgi:collagen type I/II/III/V/XI/XXIV/XXVII alpha
MGKTITTAATGIVLTASNYAAYNPISVTSLGSVGNASGSAIYSDDAANWTINNAGTITSTQSGAGYGGVFLKAGGTVTNISGGLISGVAYGVYIAGSGAVVTNPGGMIAGTGPSGVGVSLPGGGTVTNGGTISGSGGVAVAFGGVASRIIFDGGAVFTGVVAGNAVTNTLELASVGSGGTVADLHGLFPGFNSVTVDAGATWHWGTFYSPPGGLNDVLTSGMSLSNAGTLLGSFYTQTGGSITNQSGGKLSIDTYGSNMLMIGGTLLNNGVITNPNATYSVSGIYLKSNAYVSNGSTGTITAFTDSVRISRAGTVINNGLLSATGLYGVAAYTYEHGIITNNATITEAGKEGAGVALAFNGLFTNNGIVKATGSKGSALSMRGDQFYPVAYNYGTLTATGLLSYGASNSGGVLHNAVAGQISGVHFGVYNTSYGVGPTATLINLGQITATSTIAATKSASVGVYSGSGDVVTNAAGAVITAVATGLHGVGALVLNAGTITGSGTAGLGVELTGGTMTTSGIIIGASGTAVSLDGTTNLLIVDPGAVFLNGKAGAGIVRGAKGTSTLELASAASAGTIGGFGTQFVSFASVAIDTGAAWTLTGINTLASTSTISNAGTLTLSNATLADAGAVVNNGTILIDPSTLTIQNLSGTGAVTIGPAGTLGLTGTVSAGETITFADTTGILKVTPGNFAATIDDFFKGDTISLTGVTDATGVTVVNNNTLVVSRSGHAAVDLTMNPARNLIGTTPNVIESGGAAIITTNDVACFAAGTHLGTPHGPVAVEQLRPGDELCMAVGGVRPIRWIGHRHLDLTRHPAPERARPVRIRAGAFGDGAPCRDLRLSPDHAVLIHRMLIPVRLLLNGGSIVSETDCRAVTYYHVELECHDVLIAERIAAESYLDTGNRSMFANGGLPLQLHPDFANSQDKRDAGSCAPVDNDPAAVKRVWEMLAARSGQIGWPMPPAPTTTRDPALRVVTGGRIIQPERQVRDRYVFRLPDAAANTIRLVSRTAVPSDRRPWVEDRRPLGVMVARLALRTAGQVQAIALDDPDLDHGWWGLERDGRASWRWTAGDAAVPIRSNGLTILEVDVADTMDYAAGDYAVGDYAVGDYPVGRPGAPLPTEGSAGIPRPAARGQVASGGR